MRPSKTSTCTWVNRPLLRNRCTFVSVAMNCCHFMVRDCTSWLGAVGLISTAMSRSLPATVRPRAHEFTTRIVSTDACEEKKLRARSATSRWTAVGNPSGELMDYSLGRYRDYTPNTRSEER